MTKQTHIGAYGLIENEGKILLAKLTKGPYKGMLGLPGGGFVHGETARDCVARQMEKNSEISINDLKLFDVLTDKITWQNDETLENLHLICILFNIKANILKLKDSNVEWFDIKNLDFDNLTPIAEKAIAGYKK